jgi:hypothetical protein
MSFDGSSAVAIQKAQSIMKKPGIKNQLIYVRSNFKIICESITQLEKNGLPLTDSIKIVEIVFYITSQVKWFLLANGGYN